MVLAEGKTNFEVVKAVVSALVAQGGQCVDEYNYCIYGDGRGSHCAGGAWIS